jgi:hypothetical protein
MRKNRARMSSRDHWLVPVIRLPFRPFSLNDRAMWATSRMRAGACMTRDRIERNIVRTAARTDARTFRATRSRVSSLVSVRECDHGHRQRNSRASHARGWRSRIAARRARSRSAHTRAASSHAWFSLARARRTTLFQRENRPRCGRPHPAPQGSAPRRNVLSTGVRGASPYCILRGPLYLPPSTDPFPLE